MADPRMPVQSVLSLGMSVRFTFFWQEKFESSRLKTKRWRRSTNLFNPSNSSSPYGGHCLCRISFCQWRLCSYSSTVTSFGIPRTYCKRAFGISELSSLSILRLHSRSVCWRVCIATHIFLFHGSRLTIRVKT